MSLIKLFLKKLEGDNSSKRALIEFKHLYNNYLLKQSHFLNWANIRPVSTVDHIKDQGVATGCQPKEKDKTNLDQLAIIKLNGGLGTSMGCDGPKSLVEIDSSHNFLDQIITDLQQLNDGYNTNVPLILMNSFHTEKKTFEYLHKKYNQTKSYPHIKLFKQHRFPRIELDSGLPFECSESPDEEWSPAGHGNIFAALQSSGMLEELLSIGKKIAFISNIDNLGASVDPLILNYFINNKFDFLIEVARKLPSDKKGGIVVNYNDQLMLLEHSQISDTHFHEFENLNHSSFFNTNSIWINLVELKKKLNNNTLNLPLIVNPKTINGIKVLQLETAMGAAVSQFQHSGLLYVDRNRFLPVKTTADLLLIRSDLFRLDSNGKFNLAKIRSFEQLPNIKWEKAYHQINHFNQQFQSIPSLIDCQSLEIAGAVRIGNNVVFKGDVYLSSDQSDFLENCTVLNRKIIKNK